MACRQRYRSTGHMVCSITYMWKGRVSSGRIAKLERRKVAVLYFENAVRSGSLQKLSPPFGNSEDWRGKQRWRYHTKDWSVMWMRLPVNTLPSRGHITQKAGTTGNCLPRLLLRGGAQQDIVMWMVIIKALSDTEGRDRDMRKVCWIHW